MDGLTETLADGQRIAQLIEQCATLEAQASELNESTRLNLPAVARSAILAELESVLRARAKCADELSQLQSASAPALDNVRAAMLQCVGQPDVLDGEPEQVRAIVRRAFPVLTVRHGKLIFDPTE